MSTSPFPDALPDSAQPVFIGPSYPPRRPGPKRRSLSLIVATAVLGLMIVMGGPAVVTLALR